MQIFVLVLSVSHSGVTLGLPVTSAMDAARTCAVPQFFDLTLDDEPDYGESETPISYYERPAFFVQSSYFAEWIPCNNNAGHRYRCVPACAHAT